MLKVDDIGRLMREVSGLPLKQRLVLLECLKSETVVERDDGLRFKVESLQEYKRVRRTKAANEPLVEWIKSFRAGDVFFDIGANTGSLSLAAARLHEGRVPVFAFEPASDTFAALSRNVVANGLSGVITALQVALFDETGIKPLHRSSAGAGTALHAVGVALDYARRPFTPAGVEHVLAFCLDDLVRLCRLPAPTRIKLDVDGFEDRVLAGATEVLKSSRCELYVELVEADRDDRHPDRVTAFLERLGYERRHLVERRPPGVYPRVMDALFVGA